MQAVLDDDLDGTTHQFPDAYVEFLNDCLDDFGTVHLFSEPGAVYFVEDPAKRDPLPARRRGRVLDYRLPPQGPSHIGEERVSSMDSQHVWTRDPRPGETIYSARLDTLLQEIRKTWKWRTLERLSGLRKQTGMKETHMLQKFWDAGPENLPDEWKHGNAMWWPECARNDFNVNLQVKRVNIH